jgi:phosphatidylethanolamine-binding protein (PEBP) family uncharacterized protein
MPQQRLVKHAGRSLGLLASLLAAGSIAAGGCGEASSTTTKAGSGTSGQPAVASAPGGPSTTPPGAGASQTSGTTGTQTTHAASGAPATHPAHRSRAHLVLPPAGSQPAPKLTPSQRATVAISDILLSSPAIKQVRNASTPMLAQRYTCSGQDQSPPMRWSGVPAGTSELVLFAISTQPVGGKLFFDWALAGLDPHLKGLESGTLPTGAVVGRNGYRHAAYSICPASGKRESYAFVLYALPRSLTPKAGFDPEALRRQAMQLARHTGLLVGTYGQ